MRVNRKHTEAAQRFAERREREDAAPRLHDVAPDLTSLSVEVEDRIDGTPLSRHVRRVVVDVAPALFVIPCGEVRCDGHHDVTAAVLAALGRRQASFEGSDRCRGSAGPDPCNRVLHYRGIAEYRA